MMQEQSLSSLEGQLKGLDSVQRGMFPMSLAKDDSTRYLMRLLLDRL